MSDGSYDELTSLIRPQSECREAFFQSVIRYANQFMKDHQVQFDSWRSRSMPPTQSFYEKGNTTSIQPGRNLGIRNTFLAHYLASLAENEVSQFFWILQKCEAIDRGEVPNILVRKLIA
jgi:hypothetical protein